MAVFDASTVGLLAAVRRAAFLPDVSDQSDDDLLAFADEALATLIAATIRPGREGYWLASESISIVPGTREYTIPRRALGKTVRGVMAYRPDGTCYALDEGDPITLRTLSDGTTSSTTWDPARYAWEESTLRLDAVSTTPGWSLRVFYLRTPPKLIMFSAGGTIGSAGTTTLTLTNTPSTDVTATGALVDIVAGAEPYYPRATNLVVSTWSAPTLTLTTSISSAGVEAFTATRPPDVVVPADQTVYPPIPRTLWPALVRSTAALCLQATRDPQAQQMADAAELARRQGVAAMSPRDDRRSRSMVGVSPLRARSTLGWRTPR